MGNSISGGARPAKLLVRLLAGAAVAAIVAGCETTARGPAYTGSIGNSAVVNSSDLTQEQALVAVQKWGKAYSGDEKDKVAALARTPSDSFQAPRVSKLPSIGGPP